MGEPTRLHHPHPGAGGRRLTKITLGGVNEHLLRKQHLTADTKEDSALRAVADLKALHGTYPPTAYTSLWARVSGIRAEDVDHELHIARRLARFKCMRKTVFVVRSVDLPVFHQATAAKLSRELLNFLKRLPIPARESLTGGSTEIDDLSSIDAVRERVMETLSSRGPLTAKELTEAIPELGVRVGYGREGYMGSYSLGSRILPAMCDLGDLIRGRSRGTMRSSLYEYGLFSSWLPKVDLEAIAPAEARRTLVRGYLTSLGPARLEDLIWWSGMTKTEVLASLEELEGEIHRVEIKGLEGEHLVMAGEEETIPPGRAGGEPVVNLLPALDHYVMGYKDRRRFLDPEHHDQVFDRSGNAFPTVLLNGRIVGVWYEAGRKTKILLWEEVSGEVRRTISGEAIALAGFLGNKTTPTIEAYPSDLRVETPYRLGRR